MVDRLIENTDKNLTVIVKSRKKTFFDGEALSVSSNNDTGEFDVLPHHANFITMIKDFVRVTKPDGGSEEFEAKKGVMRVYEDHVDLYLTV